MINTTDFLNALRNFEYVVEQKNLPKNIKEQLKIHLLSEIDTLVLDICNIDLDDEMEVIDTKYKFCSIEALKNL